MNLNKIQIDALSEFTPQLETFSRKFMIWIYLLLIIMAVAVYAFIVQIREGHIITGMRDNVVWGLYIANFIFFIGIGYAGAVISGILHLLNVAWRKPVIRIAELITVIATWIGPLYILLCVGRLDRLDHLVLFPRLQSPIIWDVLAIGTYLVGGLLFLYLATIKDFAIYRDTPSLKVGAWRKKLYKILSRNYHGSAEQDKSISISMNLMAIILVPLVVIVSSILSWIFGMTLQPGWHSTIFGPYFVLAAIYSGTGVLIISMWVFRKIYHLEKYLLPHHFVYLGYILLVLAAGYGYFTFSEYLTSWYNSEKWESEVIGKLFNLNQFGWWFLFANVAGILIPILVVAIPRTRNPNAIALASAIMVLALWVKRYLIIIPTLESPLLPIQDTRPEFVTYSATWVEWVLTFGGIATFFFLISMASKFITIIPISEFAEEKKQ